ncbi:hypothetical protein JL721_10195 [Aureococcus anophagefferens]|nr:hypothetical protein JL721_10195 [Aureococcus anophagefferens]
MVLPHVFGCLFFVLLLVKLRDPRSLAWAAVFLPLLCADLSSFARRADETRAALKGLDDARETGVIPPDALDQMRGGAGGAPVAPENAGGDRRRGRVDRRGAVISVLGRDGRVVRAPGSAACSGGPGARAPRGPAAPARRRARRAEPAAAPPPPAAPERGERPAARRARDGDAAPAAAETPDDDDDDASRADDDEPDAAAKRRGVRIPASLAGDAYGALPALNVTAAFDSLCGALDKRDAKSSPTTDAILLPVICMYAALFVLHPLVLRDSKKFQQVVQIVVIEADDGLAEARAQLARQQLQGVFELSGAPRSMIGVEDDSVLVEALAMPTRLLKHSSTLYARAAVAPLDVDDALPPLGLQLPDLKAAAAPPDLDDAPETPRKPPRKVLEAPAAPEDDGAAAAGDGGAAPEVGDGDDDDDASLGSSACESSIFDDGALDADLDAPPPRAASPVERRERGSSLVISNEGVVVTTRASDEPPSPAADDAVPPTTTTL